MILKESQGPVEVHRKYLENYEPSYIHIHTKNIYVEFSNFQTFVLFLHGLFLIHYQNMIKETFSKDV